jgi:putative ABC transport system permease protein
VTRPTPGQRLHAASRRVLALFRRRALERDLDDEIGFHLAMRAEGYAADGKDDGDVRARRRLGNPLALKEELREAWTFAPLETLAQDLRFALRVLLRNPGFTAVAVLSLALGIGANAAMFSFVSGVLLRPLPYPDAERLVRVTGSWPKGALVAGQQQSRTLEVAGFGEGEEFNLTGQGEAVRVAGSTVSANLFAVLGARAALGRGFEPGEDRPGRDGLALLSHALWQSRFGGDPGVLGRTILVEGVPREVVGVMPASFRFPASSAQLWVPLRLDPGQTDDYWGFGWMPVVARLRPGATLAQAQGELGPLVGRIAGLFPWPAPTWNAGAELLPLHADLVRDVRRPLLLLQAAVGIVLLIACANVASLLLARAASRRKEIALRASLGASRARIVRQLLTESVALSLVGGLVGVALAGLAVRGLKTVLPADASGFAQVAVDGGVLAFVTGLSVLSGLWFGLAPAASASRLDLARAMKAGGRATPRAGARLRGSFIAAEVALAVVLAVGAGLLIRTLIALGRVDPGFRTSEVLTVRVAPNPAACAERAACLALYDELVRRTRELAGIGDVALANAVPLSGQEPLLPVEMDGHPVRATDPNPPLVWAGAVTPGYFRLMGIPLVRGRALEEADGESTEPVVVVSASTAHRYWPGQDPVGKRIRVMWESGWRRVVGVAGDVRQYELSGRSPALISGALYMPYPQSVGLDRRLPKVMTLLARTTGGTPGVTPRLRGLAASLNPEVPVGDVRAIESVVAASVAEPRSLTWLFAGFAACALALAAVGSYGVVSYATGERTYEIAVRMAVGATRREILALVLGSSLRLVLVGLALGVVAALALGRALSGFLYGVSATDPLTFGVVVGLLVLTALVAGYVPGRRAARTNPVRALRLD